VLLTGHSAPVVSTAISPDGKTLASGSYDHTAILWDLPSGTMRCRLEGHAWNVQFLAFSLDGSTLASADFDSVRFWDVQTGRWQGTFPGLTGPLLYGHDPKTLIARSDDELVLLDGESGQVHRRLTLLERDETLIAAAIAPNASIVAAGIYRDFEELRVWDFQTGVLKRTRRVPRILWWKERDPQTGKLRRTRGAGAGVSHLALSPDSRLLAVGGDLTLWLLDTRTGKRKHLLLCGHDGTHSVAFAADGKLFAAGTTNGAVILWSIPSGKLLQTLPAHRTWATAVVFSPDGQVVAGGSHDKTVKVWRVDTGECWRKLPGAEYAVLTVQYSPDGKTLVSGHEDGTLRFWNAETGELSRTIRCEQLHVASAVFSRDGSLVVSACYRYRHRDRAGAIELWSAATGERQRLIKTGSHAVVPVLPSPDLSIVVASCRTEGDESTFAWDLETGSLRYQVEGRDAALSPDAQHLATTIGWEKTVHLWDAASGERLREMAAPQVADWIDSLRFSPDGRTLLGGFGGFGMGLWEVESGKLLWEVRTHADSISAAAFSPDGSTLSVGGGYDNEVVLWDLLARKERLTFVGHESSIRDVTFSPDGKKLATASDDGTIRLWSAAEGRLLATLMVLPRTDDALSEDWIGYIPSGHYHGSPEADRVVRWQVGEEFCGAEVYRDQFRQPEQVADALRPGGA
jgi:WD40 repeat protein